MKNIIYLIVIIASYCCSSAQTDSTANTSEYTFTIQDSPAQLFTMRQFDQCYLSAYRLFARGLNTVVDDKLTSDLLQIGLQTLFALFLNHISINPVRLM